jgi:hypothetical protein
MALLVDYIAVMTSLRSYFRAKILASRGLDQTMQTRLEHKMHGEHVTSQELRRRAIQNLNTQAEMDMRPSEKMIVEEEERIKASWKRHRCSGECFREIDVQRHVFVCFYTGHVHVCMEGWCRSQEDHRAYSNATDGCEYALLIRPQFKLEFKDNIKAELKEQGKFAGNKEVFLPRNSVKRLRQVALMTLFACFENDYKELKPGEVNMPEKWKLWTKLNVEWNQRMTQYCDGDELTYARWFLEREWNIAPKATEIPISMETLFGDEDEDEASLTPVQTKSESHRPKKRSKLELCKYDNARKDFSEDGLHLA